MTQRTFEIPAHLWAALEQMSAEMAVPTPMLVNQALFSWARINGYVVPSTVDAAVTAPPAAPVVSPANARALGPRPVEPEPIETTIPSMPTVPRVVLVVDNKEIPVAGPRFVIGRDASCDLAIESSRISRHHAAIHVTGDKVELEDLKSSNGTWFKGEKISRREVHTGDEFYVGDALVRFEVR